MKRLVHFLICLLTAAVFAYFCVGDLTNHLEPARAAGLFVTFVVTMTVLLFIALENHLSLRERVETLEKELENRSSATDEK